MITITLTNQETLLLRKALGCAIYHERMVKDSIQYRALDHYVIEAMEAPSANDPAPAPPPKIIQIQAFQPTERSWHAIIGLAADGNLFVRTLTNDGWSEWTPIDSENQPSAEGEAK